MKRGFTLVETLVVVAILGLLAAIAIPMYLNSINRAKQARTIANIKTIATAWESRAIETKAYNAAGASLTLPARVISPASLQNILSPTYIKDLPRTDGWGWALDFKAEFALNDRRQATTYSIRSMGRDGKLQSANRRRYTIGPTKGFDCDIVFANGMFIAYPYGAQK